MKAIVISRPGGANVLQVAERPMPLPAPGEVLIKVMAAGVNRPDIVQREGQYPAPPGAVADIPGLEVAGMVAEIVPGEKRWKQGDRVCALLSGGGYAQYVIAPSGQCLPLPAGVSMVEAASLPETFFTVWSNVFDIGQFAAGQKVLVHGGASGIGVTAIQMLKAMGGVVYTTAGTDIKCQFARQLGASEAVNYATHDFEQEIKRLEPKGVNIVLDMIGGSYASKNIRLLATEGHLLIISTMGGPIGEIDLMRVMLKRLTITGATLRARDAHFKAQIASKLEQHIWPLIETGAIKPVIDSVFSLTAAAAAHQHMESNQHIGKIVLKVED